MTATFPHYRIHCSRLDPSRFLFEFSLSYSERSSSLFPNKTMKTQTGNDWDRVYYCSKSKNNPGTVHLKVHRKQSCYKCQFYKSKQYTVMSGCKPWWDGDSEFPNCSVIWMGKVTCIVQKQQSIFGRLLMMDCQENSLEHCLIGLFGWMYLVFYNTNTVLSDQQQKRTLGTVTDEKLIFRVFSQFHSFQPDKFFLGGSLRPVGGGGGGVVRLHPTHPHCLCAWIQYNTIHY